ncbi:30S ribosomal protein S3 [Candidatus Saccharibacteria bacterium]|nr:30S ribosomal protein S3 [Candidatus Saccharibacteria bacterium]
MPRKVNPRSLRTGSFLPWKSRWFAGRDYAKTAAEDAKIRRFVRNKLQHAGLESVEVERRGGKVKVIITVSKPGLVIGRGGGGAEILRDDLGNIIGGQVELDIQEVKEPALSAAVVADRVAQVLRGRGRRYRAIANEIVDEVIAKGAGGIKIELSGRIGGAEIARREYFVKGSVPHSTLRADIDFARSTSHTRYGTVGVKVWIFRGEIGRTD